MIKPATCHGVDHGSNHDDSGEIEKRIRPKTMTNENVSDFV
jgi:hypothetical protein